MRKNLIGKKSLITKKMTPSRFPNRPQQIDKYNTKKYRHSKFATFIFLLFIVFAIPLPIHCIAQKEDDREFYMPTKCESCMVFAAELDADVGRLPPKMRPDEAEAWLLDELEKICERMLSYRVHRNRPGLARFAKQMTGTAKTIKTLKERGVEVKLDVSDELLDRPSIESGRLKEHCEWIQERFEEDIERWFTTERRHLPISKFLCHGKRFSSEVGVENCANEINREIGKKEKAMDEL